MHQRRRTTSTQSGESGKISLSILVESVDLLLAETRFQIWHYRSVIPMLPYPSLSFK